MTYPETPGHQSHSQTSRDAARAMESKAKYMRARLDRELKSRAYHGMTIDEAAVYLTGTTSHIVAPGTASARMRELELSGMAVKTTHRRKTRADKSAVVYMTPRVAKMMECTAACADQKSTKEAHHRAAYKLAEMVYQAVRLQGDGGGSASFTPLDVSVMRALARECGLDE